MHLHTVASSRPSPELMPLRVAPRTFLGIRTCSRCCRGCRVFALGMWIAAVLFVVGFVGLMVVALESGR